MNVNKLPMIRLLDEDVEEELVLGATAALAAMEAELDIIGIGNVDDVGDDDDVKEVVDEGGRRTLSSPMRSSIDRSFSSESAAMAVSSCSLRPLMMSFSFLTCWMASVPS